MPNQGFPDATRVVRRTGRRPQCRRSGTAVVELALLLPLLVFLFLVAADFARVYYFSLTLTNCARAGALYASDPTTMGESPFPTMQAAALADATNISPSPTITQVSGSDATGRMYVDVTAAHTFGTIAGFPGIPDAIQLRRTVRMYVAANKPSNY